MLVLVTFLTIGVFSIAFLLRFLLAVHSEARLEKERDARTRQIANYRIAIAVEARTTKRGFIVTSSNPEFIWPGKAKAGLRGTPMRRALADLSGLAVQVPESSQTKREA